MASPFRLIREQLRQTKVDRAPLVARRVLDHHRFENRVPEPQLADAVIDHDEMVAFGRPEFLESSGAARCRQHPEVAGSVQRGEQEQATRRLREAARSSLGTRFAAAGSNPPSRWCGRCRVGRRPMRRTPARPADCLPPPRRRAAGRGSASGRIGESATPSTPPPGVARSANSGNPVRSKNPPTPGRIAPRSPIGLPRNRRPTNPTTAPLARSSQCRSSTTMSSGFLDAA